MLARNKLKLERWKENAQLRTRHLITKSDRNAVIVEDKSVINFCSNDYLGLSKNPQIIEAYSKGINEYGLGSGASALISGYSEEHSKILNIYFANWLGVEKAILFNSGYLANIGIISSHYRLNQTIILSDKSCHASLLMEYSYLNQSIFVINIVIIIDLNRLAES